jgi:chemotaxis protein MotA
MLFIIGAIVVTACVLGGYVLHGGNLAVLWQPTEILIIGGAAVGSFIIANPVHTIKEVGKGIVTQLTGSPFNKSFYMDLLSLLYEVFDKSRKQGVMAIEEDIDDPRLRAIVSTLRRSVRNIHLEFNPIFSNSPEENTQESNPLQ